MTVLSVHAGTPGVGPNVVTGSKIFYAPGPARVNPPQDYISLPDAEETFFDAVSI